MASSSSSSAPENLSRSTIFNCRRNLDGIRAEKNLMRDPQKVPLNEVTAAAAASEPGFCGGATSVSVTVAGVSVRILEKCKEGIFIMHGRFRMEGEGSCRSPQSSISWHMHPTVIAADSISFIKDGCKISVVGRKISVARF